MIRRVAIFLFSVLSATSWSQFGYLGSASGYSASEADLEISPSGKVYVAVIDPSISNRVVVKQYETATNTWTTLGGGPASFTGRSDIQLTTYNDFPAYVASFDTTIGQNIESFEVKYWTGSSWNNVIIPGTASTKHSKGYSLVGEGGLWLTYYNKDNSVFNVGLITVDLLTMTQLGNVINTNEADVKGFDAVKTSTTWKLLVSEKESGNNELNLYALNNGTFDRTVLDGNLPAAQCGIKYDPSTQKSVMVYSQGNNIKIATELFGMVSPFVTLDNGSGPLFDLDVENNVAYVFTKTGSARSLFKISSPGLAQSVQTLFQGTVLAPGNATNLHVEVWNGVVVVSYVSGQMVFVKEILIPPILNPVTDISVCPGQNTVSDTVSVINNHNFTLTTALSWIVESMNPAVLPASQIETTQIGDSLDLTISGLPDASQGASATIRIIALNPIGSDTVYLPLHLLEGAVPQLNVPAVYCRNDLEVNLDSYVNPVYGVWTGAGVSGSTFNPAAIVSNADSTVSLLFTASYQSGCIYQDSAELLVHPIPHATISTIATQCGNSNGAAFADVTGGTAPYTYSWSSGSSVPLVTNLDPGQYQLTVTDANGCRIISAINISTIGLDVTGAVSSASCATTSDGSIDVSVSGVNEPFNYIWSTGATTEDLSGLAPGSYDLAVIDSLGCQSSISFIIPAPAALVITTASEDASTCGTETGSLEMVVTGGEAPYIYNWIKDGNPISETSPEITGYSSGIFQLTVQDALGCEATIQKVITNADGPVVFVDTVGKASCADDGLIEVSSADLSLSYNWSDGQSGSAVSNLSAGDYVLTATNATGCSTLMSITVPHTTPEPVSICTVSVDTTDGSNVVIWDVPQTNGISRFNVYRETSVAGEFMWVGSTDYSDGGMYRDTIGNSMSHSWRYRIDSEDNCGVKSAQSSYFKTMHIATTKGINGSYNLFWDAFEGYPYANVHLNRYTESNGWEVIQEMPSNLFTYTDSPTETFGLTYMVTVDAPLSCAGAPTGLQDRSFSNLNSKFATINDLSLSDVATVQVNVYPNPSSALVNIYNPELEELSLSVVDASGRLVLTASISSGTSTLDLSNLSMGMYQLHFQTSQGISSVAFSKVD